MEGMNLYTIEQDLVDGYDTYTLAVVAAKSEEHARHMHPNGRTLDDCTKDVCKTWCSESEAHNVQVTLIGKAVDGTKPGVVCADYAGV